MLLWQAQVYSVYLFHELPPEIRRKAVAEMARVLKPGGVAIITDSIQLGDRERLDANLGRFGDFNEPFYRTYITEDFGARLPAPARTCPVDLLYRDAMAVSSVEASVSAVRQ